MTRELESEKGTVEDKARQLPYTIEQKGAAKMLKADLPQRSSGSRSQRQRSLSAGLFLLAACLGVASFILGWCEVHGGFDGEAGHRSFALGFAVMALVAARVVAAAVGAGRRAPRGFLVLLAAAASFLAGSAWFDLANGQAAVHVVVARFGQLNGLSSRDALRLMDLWPVRVVYGAGIYVAFVAAVAAVVAAALALFGTRATAD